MDYRYILVFLALLQLPPFIYADCVGYTESFDVRVLDANLRPLSDANVTIKYDRGASFGEKYFTTPPQLSNAAGIVHFDILNQGTTTRTIDCNIVVTGSIYGFTKTVTVIAEQHGPVVDVIMSSVYPLRFYVRDQFKAPLPNASVTIGPKTGKTDQNGMVLHFFKTGTYDYFASYIDASEAGKVRIENDTEYEVVFPHYKISIDVSDDSGKPLSAALTIFNTTFGMANGHFENEKTFGEEVPYKVDYLGLVTEGVIKPATDPIVTVTYDINSPLFESITPEVLNNRYRLNIVVSDPNQFASGVEISSFKVSYKVEPSDATAPWSSAIVFTTGRNKFTADFPELPLNSIVRFRMEMKDKAGNKAEKEGTFSTYGGGQQNGTNGDGTQPPPPSEQGIPLSYIIVGVFILILAAYLVFRMKSQAGGGA